MGNKPPRLSEDGRSYIIGGKSYVRLSEVMDWVPNYGLVAWENRVGAREAERIKEETSAFGTAVHDVTMYWDQKKMGEVERMLRADDSLLPFLLAWQEWAQEMVVRWVAIEEIVWSEELRVAGRLDRVALLRGDKMLSIPDIKTGWLGDGIGMRLAAYKIMWNERNPKKSLQVGRYMAVNVPRLEPGSLRVREYTDEKHEKRVREVCRGFHERREERGE